MTSQTCPECGEAVPISRWQRKYCTEDCSYLAERRRKPHYTQKSRARFLAEEGHRCGICGEALKLEDMEIDHIQPTSRGGGNERSNLQAAHRKCNRHKAAKYKP